MTTPERLKRRQQREGWGILALGVLIISTTVYDSHEDREQKAAFQTCIVETVKGLREVIEDRGDLNVRKTAEIDTVILSVGKATRKQDAASVLDALETYRINSETIRRERAKAVAPDFPSGECQ